MGFLFFPGRDVEHSYKNEKCVVPEGRDIKASNLFELTT
jgi:hypothetical protein